jgi:hypothetical protein
MIKIYYIYKGGDVNFYRFIKKEKEKSNSSY